MSTPTSPTTLTVSLPGWVDHRVARWEERDGATRSLEDRVRFVIELARDNVERQSGGPFAAAVFETDSGRLVGAGVNSVERLKSSSLHAEIVAVMMAQRRLGRFTFRGEGLPDHDLVSSCEPCAMCLGATLWSGVRRLVWGAGREDAQEIGFDEGPVFPESLEYLRRRGIELVPDVLRAEGREVLELYRRGGGLIYNP